MTDRPMIAVLGGARETVRAVEWLARAGAQGFVIWEDASEPERTAFVDGLFEALGDADAILDVSHAFDEATRAAAVARVPSLPYARVGRAPWVATAEDKWTEVDTLTQAVDALPPGARVFAATGRGSLGALAKHDGQVCLRQLTEHDLPMPLSQGRFVFGAAPFSVANEVTLFQELQIDVVLARNIGGAGSFPKLGAARQLGLPVVLLRPPALPKGPHLGSYDDIKNWIMTL